MADKTPVMDKTEVDKTAVDETVADKMMVEEKVMAVGCRGDRHQQRLKEGMHQQQRHWDSRIMVDAPGYKGKVSEHNSARSHVTPNQRCQKLKKDMFVNIIFRVLLA